MEIFPREVDHEKEAPNCCRCTTLHSYGCVPGGHRKPRSLARCCAATRPQHNSRRRSTGQCHAQSYPCRIWALKAETRSLPASCCRGDVFPNARSVDFWSDMTWGRLRNLSRNRAANRAISGLGICSFSNSSPRAIASPILSARENNVSSIHSFQERLG